MSEDKRQRCNRCTHYFITHNIQFPYGCHALNFKSRREPVRDVIEASGQPCQFFQPKPKSGA